MEINFATATPAQLAEMGFTFKKMTSTATRTHKSLFGVKPTVNKKGMKKVPLNQATEEFKGLIR